MSPDIVEFVQVASVITALVGAITAIGVGAYVTVRRASRQAERPRISEDRFRHLEQAVDAIAVEVERISEGQRFTTKLLAERLEAPPAPRVPERVITPH